MKTFSTIILIIGVTVVLMFLIIDLMPKPSLYQNGNIGIGDGGHPPELHIYSGSGTIESMSPEQFERFEKGLPKKTIKIRIRDGGQRGFSSGECPSEKLIITSDNTIHIEPEPVKRLIISPKEIFRVNSDSTIITFAGHQYIKKL